MHITLKNIQWEWTKTISWKAPEWRRVQSWWLHNISECTFRSGAVFLDKDNTSSALMKVHFFATAYNDIWENGVHPAFLATVWKRPFLCHHDNADVHKEMAFWVWWRRTWPQPHSFWLNLNANLDPTSVLVAKWVQIPVATTHPCSDHTLLAIDWMWTEDVMTLQDRRCTAPLQNE